MPLRFAGRFALTLSLVLASAASAQNLPPYLQKLPAFNPTILPTLPGDVDIALQNQLEGANKFAEVQREFDLNAWQMFLALNWPILGTEKPLSAITDAGPPRWSRWAQAFDVFRSDGKPPVTCNASSPQALTARTSPPLDMSLAVSRGLPPLKDLLGPRTAAAVVGSGNEPRRVFGTISSVGELNAVTLASIKQAFSGPIIDQNGELVFYDIVLDPNESQYICANALYNINGQIAFNGAGKKVSLPAGTASQPGSGAFELKFAWKILGKTDDQSRFYNIPATVIDVDANGKPVARDVTVGLVGMHIAHKSESSPQWIWATFEQIDNLATDAVANPKLSPSFNNPNCEYCAVNQPVQKNATGGLDRTPTQIARAIPIPEAKVALNREAQAALHKLGSVWQYYQLIDTQWPTKPSASPTPASVGLPGAVANKPGGNPTPIFLTNVTMETFFQKGNQPACQQEEGSCPTPLPANEPTVFGSESCMGCHSSAGIWASFNGQTGTGTPTGSFSADFSWLFQQKACFVGGTAGKNQVCR